MLRRLAPIALVGIGAAVVVLFFLPWLSWHGLEGVSGWSLATDDGNSDRALLMVPACGLLLIACGLYGKRFGLVAGIAGGIIVVVTAWVFIRPMFPSDKGFIAAVLGAILVIGGSFLDHRVLRLIGGLAIGASFELPWLGQTGAALTHPSCPHAVAKIVPWGVVIAAALSLASAIAPRRAAQILAWSGALLAIATVFVFVVTSSEIGIAAWSTVLAGLCPLAIAGYGTSRGA